MTTRLIGRWVLAIVSAIAAIALIAAPVATASAPAVPAHLLVYAQEWSLIPSRTSVPAGVIDVELWNRGQDAHDLRIRKLNKQGQMYGAILGAVKTTLSGQISEGTWHLKAGRYEIYCSMPGHLQLGMHTRLRVTS